jgi:hypothetical protein
VFNTIVPPGLLPFLEQLYDSGFTQNGVFKIIKSLGVVEPKEAMCEGPLK